MKENKLFDRPQLFLTVMGLSCFATGMVLFVIMVFTSTISYDESGAIANLTYNPTLFAIFSCFNLLAFTALVWFVIRLATYKLRIKEKEAQE